MITPEEARAMLDAQKVEDERIAALALLLDAKWIAGSFYPGYFQKIVSMEHDTFTERFFNKDGQEIPDPWVKWKFGK